MRTTLSTRSRILGPTDALISVLERAPPYPPHGYPPRPAHLAPTLEPGTNLFCVPDPARLDAWITFSEGDRAFYLLVAVGESASDDTQSEVFAILDRLRFDERTEVNSAEPAPSPSEPACIPRGHGNAGICSLAPPHRPVQGGNAFKVTTVTGESFWVILPDELAPPAGVVAVPGVPVRVNAGLTTAPDREAADSYCDDFPECEPIVVTREKLPFGAVLTRWDDASGTIEDSRGDDGGLWPVDARHAGTGRSPCRAGRSSAELECRRGRLPTSGEHRS